MADLGSESLNPFDPILTTGSGPVGEAKTTTVSNWFYYLGAGIADGLDGQQRTPMANAGVNFGVGADGQIYVQGSAGGANQPASAATFRISPTVLLLAGMAFWMWRKG